MEALLFRRDGDLMTRSGKVLDEDTLKRRITVGVPISVHYIGEGDNKVI